MPPPAIDAQRLANIREAMGLSQELFAKVLNVSPVTDRSWEQEQRAPDGAANVGKPVYDGLVPDDSDELARAAEITPDDIRRARE